MNTVTINKAELLTVVKANRERHHNIFIEAQQGYREAVIEALDRMQKDAREGRRIQRSIRLPEPVDQTKDYDRVIRMLEMSVNEEIELTETDFAAYVMDQWHWRANFAASNRRYTTSSDATAYLASIESQSELE